MTKDDLDIIKVTKWECPSETGIPLITMPNIPKPLHALPPRNVMGKTAWDRARKLCYFKADYKCEICGCEPSKGQLHCLEARTEVMTAVGFKPIEEVTKFDLVAQYEPYTKQITFVNPTSTVVTHVDKKVSIGYKNRFRVGYSDKHRILLEHTVNYNNPRGEKHIEYRDSYPEGVHFSGSNRIPTAGFAPHGRGLTADERIFIALNADGSWQYKANGLNYHTIRVKKARKQKRIKELLSKSTLRFSEISEKARPEYLGFSIWTKPYCKDFWKIFDLKTFTQEMAKDFIDELCKWDGWEGKRKSGSGKKYNGRCWYTTSEKQADFVQAVAALAGITTTMSVTKRACRDWSISMGNRVPSEECLPQINIEFLSRDSRGIRTMERSVEKVNEDMYCITVPSTYFVARSKDGYIFITGNCHELYTIDYLEGTSTFNRCIAICKQDHDFIHSGRLITLFKEGNPLYPNSYVLKTVEKGFKLVSEYNKSHPDLEPLRVYDTFIDYLKVPELADEMAELIRKYDIKFYTSPKRGARWEKWRLVWNGKEYPTPYKNPEEWMEAMKKASQNDTVRQVKDPFTGGVYDELRKMLEQSA